MALYIVFIAPHFRERQTRQLSDIPQLIDELKIYSQQRDDFILSVTKQPQFETS